MVCWGGGCGGVTIRDHPFQGPRLGPSTTTSGRGRERCGFGARPPASWVWAWQEGIHLDDGVPLVLVLDGRHDVEHRDHCWILSKALQFL